MKARDLIGQRVVDLSSGKALGTVKDLIIDTVSLCFTTLMVDENGWFKQPLRIPARLIASLGAEGVLVQGAQSDEEAFFETSAREVGLTTVLGERVVSQAGVELGTVDDLDIEPLKGLKGIHVSGGPVHDLISGRYFINGSDVFSFGNEVLIVSDKSGVDENESLSNVWRQRDGESGP